MLSHSRTERYRLVGKRHGSARKLADKLDLAHTTVARTLNGQLSDEATQTRIARACGVSRNKMFGVAQGEMAGVA